MDAPEAGTPKAPGDECWEAGFQARGTDSRIRALVWDGTNVYAGGDFATAEGAVVNHVAKWDGTTWSALGTGTNGLVYALAWDGINLYAGGSFTEAGGVANTTHIAKWDGQAWSALGIGIDGDVNALLWEGTNLYAAGYYFNAGGVQAYGIAKWDGTAWSALGPGGAGWFYALAWDGTNLYAGSRNNVAMWNGVTWTRLGINFNDAVYALAWDGTNLYAGGAFTVAGGVAATKIARWDGTSWSALGTITDYYGDIHALTWDGSNLYAGGDFATVEGITVNYVAKWNGSAWGALGTGMNNSVLALAWDGASLYAGGFFTTAGGNAPYYHFAKWNGTGWSAPEASGEGTSYGVYALTQGGADLYAGGWFAAAGGVIVNNIAKWNGTSWGPLGTGMNGPVYALAWDGTNLYAGGWFTSAGGVAANYIARWDGAAWSPLGTGMNGNVSAFVCEGTTLYAGGGFTTAGGVSTNGIARWNGVAWGALGTGVTESVYSLAWDGTNLYAGGQFGGAGGVPAHSIAKWNGTSWSALGTGMTIDVNSGHVRALAWDGTNLYAGGWFTAAGGVAAKNLAKWDGAGWSALETGSGQEISALAWDGANLYAGEILTSAGGTVADCILKWNGTSWSLLGTGLNSSVEAFTWNGSSLYAGGEFMTAGGIPSAHIARWTPPAAITSHPANSTTCIGNTATFSVTATGTGLTYQWQVNPGSGWTDIANGPPYSGATSARLGVAPATSGMNGYQYRCLATGSCGPMVTSTPATLIVTTSGCSPYLSYDASFNPSTTLVQVCGDGDNVVEPGEEWQVTVRLKNTGNQDATNVAANLSVNAGSAVAATVLGNPGAFGTVANGGGTATATYRFVVSPGAACLNNLIFDVTGIVSTEGTYPGQTAAFSIPVGSTSTQNENATQQTSPLNATSSTGNSNLGPAFTLASATTATLSYAHAYVPPSSTVTLFSDEFAVAPGSNGWTVSGTVTSSGLSPTDTCAGGGGTYAKLTGASPSMSRGISTAGRTNVTLTLDYSYTIMSSGQGILVEYSTNGTGGPWTTEWSKLSTGTLQSANWGDDCGRTVVFPASCGNNPNFALRIRSIGATFSSVAVDHLNVTADNPPADWTSSAKVELVDPSNAVTVLKAYGVADGSPYNVKPYYTGPGTYQIRLSESAGGIATLTSGSMTLAGPLHCGVWLCDRPSETAPGDSPATAMTWTDKQAMTWPVNSLATSYTLYRGTQVELPALLTTSMDSCTRYTGTSTSVASMSEDPAPVPGRFYWYLATGSNLSGEGPAGNATAGARVVNSSGACCPAPGSFHP